jgi:uncharacterized membrane protein
MKALEQRIGEVLRAGTILSSLLFAAGLGMALVGYHTQLSDALLATAVVVLVATPALRVFVSVIEYVREGDWVFVVLTVVVLCALGASVAAAYL